MLACDVGGTKIFDNLWNARLISDCADQLNNFLPGVGLW